LPDPTQDPTQDPKQDPKQGQTQEESFKVIDRRLFSADGQIRDEAVREERHKQDAEPVKPSSAAGTAPPAKQSNAPGSPLISSPPDAGPARGGSAGTMAADATPADSANEPKPSRGLQMLINFVAQNAAMLLGAYPDPRTGEAMLDMEGARELVDMLDALREATRGNLATEDERLLVDVLGSLKLSYMEMTKAAAKAMKEKAKAHP
jgi:hypothetical protein